MTDDIAAWITAIYDEQERRAREALDPDWAGERPRFYGSDTGAHRDDWGIWTFHVDPQQVLARIAADRQILALHKQVGFSVFTEGGEVEQRERYCDACQRGDEDELTYPCATLRLLALPHAARPGYNEGWRP